MVKEILRALLETKAFHHRWKKLRVVPTDNHYTSIMLPFRNHLEKLGVKIHLGYRVNNLRLQNSKVTGVDFANGENTDLDYLVMATDIVGTQQILAATNTEDASSEANLQQVRSIMNKMRTAPPYVVARAYLLGKPNNPDRPDMVETPENQPVDLIFQAHKTEKSYTAWVQAAPAGEIS